MRHTVLYIIFSMMICGPAEAEISESGITENLAGISNPILIRTMPSWKAIA